MNGKRREIPVTPHERELQCVITVPLFFSLPLKPPLSLAVTSLWPHRVGSRGEIYSARWKLMLISDQVKDFKLKIVWKAWTPLVKIRDLE